MGIYYYGLSRRARKVDGHQMMWSRFFGKRPFSGTSQRWKTFVELSRVAFYKWDSDPDAPLYIIGSDELFEGTPVIFWDRNTYYWSDGDLFNDNIVGHLYKEGRRWRVRWIPEKRNKLLSQRLMNQDLNLIDTTGR